MTSKYFTPKPFLSLLFVFVSSIPFLASCAEESTKEPKPQTIDSSLAITQSNSAGNLVATAVKDYYDADVALIPSVILKDGDTINLELGQTDSAAKSRILSLYDDSRDSLRTGTMKGSEIKDFILSRLTNTLDVDLQVAGVNYDLRMRGGWPDIFSVSREHGQPLENDRIYRVVISNYFYRSPFPGYYYGDNMQEAFNLEVTGIGSIKRALEVYLAKPHDFAPLNEQRGVVVNRVMGDAGSLTIPQIQGRTHLSPYMGYHVSTRGVVTAVGIPNSKDLKLWESLPGRALPTEIILQDPDGDGDETTADGISIFLAGTVTSYKVGQLLEVSGVVHEVHTGGGFSGTSLRSIDSIKVIAENQLLPAPVILGTGGRMMNSRIPTAFVGDLNAEAELRKDDGIDFWESLEGMRVQLKTPTVTGTRGGLKDFNAAKQGRANYVEVSLVVDGWNNSSDLTSSGANFYNPYQEDFNVETVKMVDGPFSPYVDAQKLILENGDRFAEDLIGVFSFNRNTFGSGRYVFYATQPFKVPRKEGTPLEQRPKTKIVATPDHLAVATWNVENLGGSDRERLVDTARVITEHLKCPDIVNMPEIQDNNAENIVGGSAADQTLSGIIAALKCPDSDYRALNIDPIPFRDGGEFGGNIRVAMIYNANRVTFVPKGNPSATSDTFVEADGSLNQNPGRVEPKNPALDGSRKPLAAEFSFKGQRIFVIGAHLNSMLGENSPLGAIHPYTFHSEIKRIRIAGVIRSFVEQLKRRNTNAQIIVLGDFNTYYQSNSLKQLAGDSLVNLMTAPGMLPPNEWYSTDYDGNSGAIDFIFASHPLMDKEPEMEILHINSNYMVKISDHDPVLARFKL